MEIKIHLNSQSQPIEHIGVKNAYTKDGMYCVYFETGSIVYKYPMCNIFRVTENYADQPKKACPQTSEVKKMTTNEYVDHLKGQTTVEFNTETTKKLINILNNTNKKHVLNNSNELLNFLKFLTVETTVILSAEINSLVKIDAAMIDPYLPSHVAFFINNIDVVDENEVFIIKNIN